MHIEKPSLDDLKNFFFKHYAANNAFVWVAGNVKPDKIFNLAEKWFGPIPRRDIAERNLPQEPPQKEPRHLEVKRDVPASLIHMVFHNGRRTDKDYYANDLLSDILANGQSARLFHSLIKEQKLFSDINSYIAGDRDPGLFTVTG